MSDTSSKALAEFIDSALLAATVVGSVFGVVRSGRAGHVAFAVGGCITAASWFTSSTSFANPAITIGRTLSDTFAGIAPSSAPLFVLMQLLGGALGLAAAVALYPGTRRLAEDLTRSGERTPVDLDPVEARP